MVELAYEIAKGAKFKFNTMMMGNLVRSRSSIDLLSIYRLRFRTLTLKEKSERI